MAGVYIHIPFCIKKCNYCDFPSFGLKDCGIDGDGIEKYVAALIREISNDDMLKAGSRIDTVFIGGGTPSLLLPEQILKILCKLGDRYEIADNAEISMEMNPGTVDAVGLHKIREAGVNRISIGVQSFNDNELLRLGRIHDSSKAVEAFFAMREAGFDNINIDLMCGIPFQNRESLLHSVNRAIELSPEHISLYSLIIEEGTLFHKDYMEGNLELPNEDEAADMYDAAKAVLKKAGYLRYEISNFAKKGFECRHNTGYWARSDYRGYGMMSASLLGNIRFCAEKNLEDYCLSCQLPFEKRAEANEYRVLSDNDKIEEFMFLGLRMVKGVSKIDFMNNFNCDISTIYGKIIDKYVKQGMLYSFEEEGDERIAFTSRGFEVANPILADFLL